MARRDRKSLQNTERRRTENENEGAGRRCDTLGETGSEDGENGSLSGRQTGREGQEVRTAGPETPTKLREGRTENEDRGTESPAVTQLEGRTGSGGDGETGSPCQTDWEGRTGSEDGGTGSASWRREDWEPGCGAARTAPVGALRGDEKSRAQTVGGGSGGALR